jgi:hypothetical protein
MRKVRVYQGRALQAAQVREVRGGRQLQQAGVSRLCPGGELDAALAPYRTLLAQVDQLCARIGADYPEQIACRAGCSGCCILQGVLPVEAAGLALAIGQLPGPDAESLRRRLAAAAGEASCPLLADDRCALYAARPIICRTHGLPLLIEDEHGPRVDRCPLNFTGLNALPGAAVIRLETLNRALVAANAHFLASCFAAGDLPERIPLKQIADFPRSPGGRGR